MKRFMKSRHALAMIILAAVIGSCSDESRSPVEPGDGYPSVPEDISAAVSSILGNGTTSVTYTINGAKWTTVYPFGVGTGQLDPFLGVQAAPSEEGFNTDATPLPLDATRKEFTDKLPLNNVPIIEENASLWREFILDANEAQNGTAATFSIDRFDVYVCQDADAPTYNEVSDFASNSDCEKVYFITDTLQATSDNTSGSGSTLDYRILIPAAVFGNDANTACPYTGALGADCGYYIILHTSMGHLGGIYVTGSTFEEFSTIKRPVAPQLSLVKQVVNDNGGIANASAWTLSATGASLSFSGTGSPATGTIATLGPNPVTPGVQYTLSEAGGPNGYSAAANWVCTGGGTFVSPDKITLAAGQTASCKIVNNDNPPSLTLVKEVVNTGGGVAAASAWTLTATGTSGGFSGAGTGSGATATNGPNNVTAGVQYTLSESGGPSGYTAATAWVCTGGGTFTSPDKITLALGEAASCKIVNTASPPQLSLVKEVVNDNGGTAIASAWTLTAAGTSAGFSGAGTGAGATATNGPNVVDAGVQYTLSESGGPSGYTEAAAWVCTGGGTFVSPNKITLALNETVSCKIVNDDNGPSLTLVKSVVNDNGGTALPSAWTLSRSPSTALVANVEYTLSESGGPSGYSTTGIWSCTGGGSFVSPNKITLALGDNVTCTITNTDDPPSLTLVKNVVNDNGGTAIASAWTLSRSPSTALAAGVQYTLSESGGPAGYSSTGIWSCTGGGTFESPNKITLALGDNVTCTITNTDDPPSLTLVKNVVNDNGGTAIASAWTLSRSPSTALEAGVQYTLSESGGPAGYSSTGVWSCTGGGTFESPNKITLALGDNVTCTITNTDDPPSLTLVKNVVNDNNGTALPSAWTLSRSPSTALAAGVQYTLSESGGPAGYTSTGIWSCTGGGTFESPNKITLALGDNVTCTITNDDVPPSDALFLVIDEDGIDNDKRYWENAGPFTPSKIKQFTARDVNDDRPGLAQRAPLRYFQNNVGDSIWLWTGQVGDEGWFAPKTILQSWDNAGPTSDGLRNFLGNPVGPGLGTGSNPESLLDKIPNVIPLRAEGLYGLIGKTVCALVWDSDISINYDNPINGSLKGEKLGVAAFEVLDVVYLGGFSSSTLPRVQILIRDASTVCGGSLSLYLAAPRPSSSSVPMDIRPNDDVDDAGYIQ